MWERQKRGATQWRVTDVSKRVTPTDIGKEEGLLVHVDPAALVPLPPPYDLPAVVEEASSDQKEKYDTSLDGVIGVGISVPQTKEDEEAFVSKFLEGLEKLFSENNNWPFLRPLLLTLENCAKCQTCSDSCPIYLGSGKQEAYRPTFRAEVLRRIVKKYIKKKNRFLPKVSGTDITLNWKTVARLAELAYRCTLCRRCAQVCPIGLDNAVVARELRKVFSQEMGIAPRELHDAGTVQQLRTGSSTGLSPKALGNILRFIEDEIEEKTGKSIRLPIDKKGAEILLIHNAGEFLAWPESVAAFAIIFDRAGVDWTLSSKAMGYDSVNYGVWYDDLQFARIAVRQVRVAKELGVKRIAIGECGHSHKASVVVADRLLTEELSIPRESSLPLLAEIVSSGTIKFDPRRNNFPVTLHDPCNIVRGLGIVEPQRRIMQTLCPEFREMEPHGVDNYCCGGGSGFAIMQSMNFPSWRNTVAGRMKLKQILEAFKDKPGPEIKKYVCAPCSNCKGQIRDLFEHYKVWDRSGILYGGLVELIVNAMVDLKEPYITWEWH
jgi:Fe-S oxidoreductase